MGDSSVMRFLDELERRLAAEDIERARQAAWLEAEEKLEELLRRLNGPSREHGE